MNVNIVNNIESFYALEDSWNDLASNNDQDDYYISFSWFKAYLQCAKIVPENMHIICITTGGSVIAIVPLLITITKGRIFNLKTLQSIGNIYTPYWCAIYKKSKLDDIVEVITHYLLDAGRNNWGVIRLKEVSEKDPFILSLDKSLRGKGSNTRFEGLEANIQVLLSRYDSAGAYFNKLKKNFRQNIRTSINRLNKDGDFKMVAPHTFSEGLDEAMDDYYEVYNNSWKDEEGDLEFHRKLAHITKREEKLRLFQLYFKVDRSSNAEIENKSYASWDADIKGIDGKPDNGYEPIASVYYILHERNAYCLKMSYRSDCNKYGAGTVLFWFSIKYMLENDLVKMVDFQKGEEKYKLQWGGLNDYRRCYLAYNPRSIRARIEFYINYKIILKLKVLKKYIVKAR